MAQDVMVVGGGLAGSECALQLARRGVRVRLVEQRPLFDAPAHHGGDLAELVCSNSLKTTREDTAAGQLKWELARPRKRASGLRAADARPRGRRAGGGPRGVLRGRHAPRFRGAADRGRARASRRAARRPRRDRRGAAVRRRALRRDRGGRGRRTDELLRRRRAHRGRRLPRPLGGLRAVPLRRRGVGRLPQLPARPRAVRAPRHRGGRRRAGAGARLRAARALLLPARGGGRPHGARHAAPRRAQARGAHRPAHGTTAPGRSCSCAPRTPRARPTTLLAFRRTSPGPSSAGSFG